MSRNEKVIKYRRGFNFDIGFLIFLIIIIYVIYHLFSYIMSSPIAEYEVQQGTIATNNVYHGLILRDETIEYAGVKGSINYYTPNNSKVSVNDIIYSIDTTGKISDKINSAIKDGSLLDKNSVEAIEDNISGFVNSYNSNSFNNVYAFKQHLQSELNQSLGSNALNTLNDEVLNAVSKNTFFASKSATPGVISYFIDGYEEMTPQSFTPDALNGLDYQKTNLSEKQTIEELSPVYKRVNSEEWDIILSIPDSIATRLAEGSYIKIRFTEDDFTLNSAYTIMKKDGAFFLDLNLKNAMIRYIDERFIDVELVLDNEAGLKIPISSITSKKFFTIPKKYFVLGGDNDKLGIMLQDSSSSDNTVKFISPTIYYENDDYYYIDSEEVTSGDKIVMSDSKSTYTIGDDTDSLMGVYNINKGYAVFKQIDIISQNDDYAIIETKTNYGLSLYDHIALDSTKVKENETIVK